MIGQTLGHYRITAKLGAGAMGVVYRATDTKLGRDVALKVLPEEFARDPERMARFEREAQVLASLNHPNIAAIYGIEEADGVRALVMELVEGPTVSERVAGGPVAIEEALSVARQMAEGLEAAHEKGITHRDLKPANIKITPEGVVKLLDFGLAKAARDSGVSPASMVATLTVAAVSQPGAIMGTPAYMAPEQARGLGADKRADIWAFGLVVYEILTGKRLFGGETISDTLAAVITREPDWTALPVSTPAPLRRLLERSLRKDPKARLRDIGEARIALVEYLANPQPEPVAKAAPLSRTRLAWGMAAFFAVALAVVGIRAWLAAPVETRVVQATIQPPAGVIYELSNGAWPGGAVVSPDGTKIAFGGRRGNQRMLWIRELGQAEARVLPGTEDAAYLFWSPDSRSVAFFTPGKLKKVEVAGGLPVEIASAPFGKGGTWSRSGAIVFAPDFSGALHKVPAGGGTSLAVTKLDKGENTHRYPEFLPDGRHFLFLARSGGASAGGQASVKVGSVDGGDPRVVMQAESQAVFASGRLLYVQSGTLLARPFDPDGLQWTGDPTPLIKSVMVLTGIFRGVFSASTNGVVTAHVGSSLSAELAWFDRGGKRLQRIMSTGISSGGFRLSPDGKRVAYTQLVGAPAEDIWIVDVTTGARQRVTFDPESDTDPVWSPDGSSVVYASRRSAKHHIAWKRVDGGEASLLTGGDQALIPHAFTPDGRSLFVDQYSSSSTGITMLKLTLEPGQPPKAGKLEQMIPPPQMTGMAEPSPDGKWLAFAIIEGSQPEIYVSSYPELARRLRVSVSGGATPRWRRDGKELYYLAMDGKLMAAGIRVASGRLELDAARELFDTGLQTGWSASYEVSADGQRFLMMVPEERGKPPELSVVVNWPELAAKSGK